MRAESSLYGNLGNGHDEPRVRVPHKFHVHDESLRVRRRERRNVVPERAPSKLPSPPAERVEEREEQGRVVLSTFPEQRDRARRVYDEILFCCSTWLDPGRVELVLRRVVSIERWRPLGAEEGEDVLAWLVYLVLFGDAEGGRNEWERLYSQLLDVDAPETKPGSIGVLEITRTLK